MQNDRVNSLGNLSYRQGYAIAMTSQASLKTA